MGARKVRTPVTVYGDWVYGQLRRDAITMKELGERIGVAPQNLSNYLHGQKHGYSYRAKIEKVLGEAPSEVKYSPDGAAG